MACSWAAALGAGPFTLPPRFPCSGLLPKWEPRSLTRLLILCHSSGRIFHSVFELDLVRFRVQRDRHLWPVAGLELEFGIQPLRARDRARVTADSRLRDLNYSRRSRLG